MVSKLTRLSVFALLLVLIPISTAAIDEFPISYRSLESEILSTNAFDCTNPDFSIPETECLALVALYNNTDGAHWTDADTNQWLIAADPCNWEGVDCEGGSNVAELRLENNGLSGPIPSALEDLTQLYALDLKDNNLTEDIPGSLGNLTKLGFFRLNNNQLSGIIPPSLGDLTQLHYLTLANNQLTGVIPETFSNLTNLEGLHLSNNQLNEPIPNIWENFSSIQEIRFHENQLTGDIPSSFLGLTTLIELSLSNNQLEGTIPDFSQLDNLEILELGSNMLIGGIPPSLGGLESLRVLNLGGNRLDGSIPTGLGLLTTLEIIGLGLNPLEGPIPQDFCDLASLQELGIPQTPGLIDQIPDCFDVDHLPELRKINLCETNLTGPIPNSIWGLTNLEQLWLCSSQFEGTIPEDISYLKQLKYLDLSRNKLYGTIPDGLGLLADNLVTLRLESNQLEGPIPRSIRDLVNLNTDSEWHGLFNTDLGYNKLYSDDQDVSDFLNEKDPDWFKTQTVAPSSVSAEAIDHTSIRFSWERQDLESEFASMGKYQIYYRTRPEDEYMLLEGSSLDRMLDTGVGTPFLPETEYDIVLRSYTRSYPYVGQQNELTSEDSNMIRVTTLPGGSQVTVESESANTLLYEDPDGNSTTVQIPSAAVTDTIELLFSPSTSTPSLVNTTESELIPALSSAIPPDLDFAGNAFALNAFKDGILLHEFVFEKPITITIEYDDNDITNVFENSQKLYYWDENMRRWEKASDTCDPPTTPILDLTNKSLGVSICHLSDFAVLGDKRYFMFLPTISND